MALKKLGFYFKSIKKFVCLNSFSEKDTTHSPFYPFKQIDSSKFECRYRFKLLCTFQIFSSLLCFCLSLQFFNQVNKHRRFDFALVLFFIIFFLLFAFIMLLHAFESAQIRKIRINNPENKCEVFLSEKLISVFELSKIYIKLVEKYVVKNRHVYYLVLDGKHISKLTISCMSEKKDKMRKMGQILASNLCINFWDCDELSSFHLIFHISDSYNEENSFDIFKHNLNEDPLISADKSFLKPLMAEFSLDNQDFPTNNENKHEEQCEERFTKYDSKFRTQQYPSRQRKFDEYNFSYSSMSNLLIKSKLCDIDIFKSNEKLLSYSDRSYEEVRRVAIQFSQLKNQLNMIAHRIISIESNKETF